MQQTQNRYANSKTILAIVRWGAILVFAALGVILLVAQKTAAGVSVTGSAVAVALPLGRFMKHGRLLLWTRVILVAALLAVATISIAGTDIRPEQRKTGNDAIDKVAAIFEDFFTTISGKSTQQGMSQKPITQEVANKFADCMRNNGLADLPSPQITDDGLTFDFSKVHESQDTIRKAQNACQYILDAAK